MTVPMSFFDCNTWLGLPTNPPATLHVPPPATAPELLAALDRAGIEQALVWHVAQRDAAVTIGNDLLAQAIRGHEGRLVGTWTILPPQTHELGDLDEFFARAQAANVRAFRAFPDVNRYLLRRLVLSDMLERLIATRAPLLLNVPGSVSWDTLYNLLAEAPALRVIICNVGVWGSDRLFRPLFANYPHVYLELSSNILDGGIESFVAEYGASRLLYGSNYPECYHGGMMLTIAHSEIADADQQAIAGGNLRRLLGEVRL